MYRFSDTTQKSFTMICILFSFFYIGLATPSEAKPSAAQEKLIKRIKSQFKNASPLLSPNTINSIQNTIGYIDSVKSGKKEEFAFEQGMIDATAAKHQSKPMCKGTLMGLVCEAIGQLQTAMQGKVMAVYMDERKVCKKEKDPKSCSSKALNALIPQMKDIMNNGVKDSNPLVKKIKAKQAKK